MCGIYGTALSLLFIVFYYSYRDCDNGVMLDHTATALLHRGGCLLICNSDVGGVQPQNALQRLW